MVTDNNNCGTFRPVAIMIVGKLKINAFWIIPDQLAVLRKEPVLVEV